MASLKELVGRYNDANDKAKKRREAWEERRRKEEAEEAKRLKKLEGERMALLWEVVSQTGFIERYKVDGLMVNFPLLVGVILEGMAQMDKDDKAFNRYLKRYEAFAAKQDSGSATESEVTLASKEAED